MRFTRQQAAFSIVAFASVMSSCLAIEAMQSSKADVQVSVRFVVYDPSRVPGLTIPKSSHFAVISPGDYEKTMAQIKRDQTCDTLIAPILELQERVPGTVVVINSQSYVKDYKIVKDEKEKTSFDPVEGAYLRGVTVIVAAEKSQEGIIISTLDPNFSTLLGLRQCSAKVRCNDNDQKFKWEEAVISKAKAGIENPCRIVLKPGEQVIVRLDSSVEQDAATIRQFVKDGKVDEKFIPAENGKDRSTSLTRQTVLILSAAVVAEGSSK
jgi:hypothetical protein